MNTSAHDPQARSRFDGSHDSLAAALQQIEDRFPTFAERLKRRFVEYGVPRRRNLNVAGTIHGGVLLACSRPR